MSLEVNTLEVAELLPQRGSESQQTVTGGSQVEVSLGIDPGVKWVHLSGMRVKKQSPNSPLTLIGRAVCVWVSCSRKKNNLLRTFFLGCDETADVTGENFTHCVFMQISADYVHKHTHEHTHTHTHTQATEVSQLITRYPDVRFDKSLEADAERKAKQHQNVFDAAFQTWKHPELVCLQWRRVDSL